MIKSKRMGCVGNGQKRNAHKFWWEGVHLEDLDIDVRIISKRILMKQDGRVKTGFIWLRIEITDRLL
jgi:hypothetical protein